MDWENCKHEFERHPALGPMPEKSAEEQLLDADADVIICQSNLSVSGTFAHIHADGTCGVHINSLTLPRAVAALKAAGGCCDECKPMIKQLDCALDKRLEAMRAKDVEIKQLKGELDALGKSLTKAGRELAEAGVGWRNRCKES